MTADPSRALDAAGLLPDGELDIAEVALQFARVDQPAADWQAARAHLSALAREAHALAGEEHPREPGRRAALLAGLIGGRHHYRGDEQTYDDPDNANLIRVTERRRGLPVALGILWLHCARAAGWGAHGIDFPGHFLLGLEGGGRQVVVDVFNGGVLLDAPALRALLKRIEGGDAELRPGLLQPMSRRGVLLRLQNNIKSRRLAAGRLEAGLAAIADMLRIAPDAAPLWREAAVVSQRLDHVGAALRCYERFLGLVPEGEAAARARLAIEELRTRLN